uniref:Acyl-CoA dehydrogenase n=2 Tax=Wuchereria bancrofti TaxID=6293 RepID=A0AAF5PIG2_WUCBA
MRRNHALKMVLFQLYSVGIKGVLPLRSYHSIRAENSKVMKGLSGLSALDIVKEHGIPIQRVSLSRGLALNRFEKDFLIYPEYSDTDEADKMLQLLSSLKKDIKAAANQEDSLMAVWDNYKLSSYVVPKKYGGVDMCYKDLLTICEGLGSYWRFYFRFEQTHLASSLILLYGNDLQKLHYLPQIASGVIRPVVGFSRPEMESNLKSVTSLCDFTNGKQNLIATNYFINAADANLLLVFAKQAGDKVVCYLVERKDGNSDVFEMGTKTSVFGRNGLEVNLLDFKQMTMESSAVLGKPENGKKISQKTLVKRITFGAAVVGFMKTLINSLSEYCNRTLQQNLPLAKMNAIKHLVTKLALNTYVLESMCYYVGGLHDEELVLSLDVEEAVIHKYARHLLSEALSSTIDVVGINAVASGMNFNELLNEIMASLLLSSTELDLKKFVASQVIMSYANANADNIRQWRSFDKRLYERIFGRVEKAISFHDPKLQHFIAEHAHPSLKDACINLEHTMWRLESLLNLLLSNHGKSIIHDYTALGAISKVIEYNFGMITTIARSSRSYSIGLRNSDLEISWAQLYCSEAANISMAELRKLYDYFRFERMNSVHSKIGESVLNTGEYCIESPITRNW